MFSLQKECDGDLEHIGLLDLIPLVNALCTGRTIKIIEGL